MTDTDWQIDGPVGAPHTLLLAHGAGQDMRSPFLDAIAGALAAGGVRVLRFRFPYMAAAVINGRPRPPDREPVLRATWHAAIDRALAQGTPQEGLYLGGKSLGGRIASLIADERAAAGLVCLGYPFHPPGKPERTRLAHLATIATPTLICQGTRDPFGGIGEVADYTLAPAVRLVWVADGEHSLKPRPAAGRTWEENLSQAAAAVLQFIHARATT